VALPIVGATGKYSVKVHALRCAEHEDPAEISPNTRSVTHIAAPTALAQGQIRSARKTGLIC